jgi:hypothetical protein
VRGKVPYKGKFVKVVNIPPGEPLLLSMEEWITRDKKEGRRDILLLSVFFPAITIPLTFMFLGVIGGETWPDILLFALAYSLPFPMLFAIAELINSRRAFRKGIYTGLFEHGLLIRDMMTTRVNFIPYALIVDFHMVKKMKNKRMEVDIVGFEKPYQIVRTCVLGDDSIGMLREIVTQMAGEDPPDLHVYGGRASKLRSIPRTSDVSEKEKD